MTPKQYLQQAYLLDEKINSRLRELDQLRRLEASVQGVDLTRERVQCSRRFRSQVENIAQKIIDLEQRINSEIDRLLELKLEIRKVIESVDNETEQLLLRLRYIEYKRWYEIAEIMGYSKRQVTRLHGYALQKIKLSLNVPKCPTRNVL